MTEQCIIFPTMDAVTSVAPIYATDCEQITISASGLAGVEEVDIMQDVGGYIVAADSAGVAYKLTALITSLNFVGGRNYGALKDATVAASGVFVTKTGRT